MRMPVGRESTEPIKKMAAQERQERLAKEREEIAARVASFRATQEKFQREREEFFQRNLARHSSSRAATILVRIGNGICDKPTPQDGVRIRSEATAEVKRWK